MSVAVVTLRAYSDGGPLPAALGVGVGVGAAGITGVPGATSGFGSGDGITAAGSTGSLGIKDDLTNAGAEWVDAPAVVDGNIVSARVPKDLPAFTRAMLEALSARR